MGNGGDERGGDVENASLRAYETNETRAVSIEQRTNAARTRAQTILRKKQTGERKRREGGVYFLKQIGRSDTVHPLVFIFFLDESRPVDFL